MKLKLKLTDYTQYSDRVLLSILIVVMLLFLWAVGTVIPQISAVILVMWGMAAYCWILTLAMVHQKRRAKKHPETLPSLAQYHPKVSILIPAHDEEIVIAQTVSLMLNLDYPDYDILIIDDRSTDQTAAILQQLVEADPSGKLAFWKRPEGSFPGKSAVLNEALEKVDGDIIAVFDADAIVSTSFLREIVPLLADPDVGAVQARKVIHNAAFNWLTRCQDNEYALDAYLQSGRDSIQGAVELRGNGQLIKREALASVGGWNNFTITDDLDLSTKLHLAGWDIRFARKVVVLEEGITHFLPLLRQRRRWAEGSLRRYLEYAGDLLTSQDASIRSKFDMIIYFMEFLLPLWVAADHGLLLLDSLTGGTTNVRFLSSLILVPLLSLSFMSGSVVAMLRFHKPKVLDAFWGAIITGLYMTVIWVPLVFWIMVKVLWQKERSLDWGKTKHTGAGPTQNTVNSGIPLELA